MARLKETKRVDPKEVYSYLTSKGVSKNHALGILANIESESAFNESAVGDNGTSIGLFQHHGPRAEALKKHSKGNWSDYKAQIDFMLTEGSTQKYLSKDFDTPESASQDFTINWERPSNAREKAKQRVKNLNKFSNFSEYVVDNPTYYDSEQEVQGEALKYEANTIPMQVTDPDTGDVSLVYINTSDFQKEIEKAKDTEKAQKKQEEEETQEEKEIREKQEMRDSFVEQASANAEAVEYFDETPNNQGIQISQIEIPERNELKDLPNIFNTQRPELASVQNPIAEEEEEFKDGGISYPPPNDNLYYGPGDSEYMRSQPLNMDIIDMYQNKNRIEQQDWLNTPNDSEFIQNQYLRNLKRNQIGDIREARATPKTDIKIII